MPPDSAWSMANDSAATGRPEAWCPGGADMDVVSGQSVRRFGFCAMAGSSSNTKMPAKLLE